jgi:ABC-type Fe3+-hydroxamate transport system substrate-binding protein
MLTKDFLNRPIVLKHIPERIISLVPSQTELLIDLGLESNIVGITKFCVHPKHLKKSKTVVGGTKQVHFDKIKKLQPDIILCNKEENTPEMVEELEKIAQVHVSDIKTLQDNAKLISNYAKLFNAESEAESILQQLSTEQEKFKNFIKDKPIKKVAYLIWRKPWMTVGHDTFIDYMLKVNNFENVFGKLSRYPEIDINQLPEIDLLLLSSEPYPFKTKHLNDIPVDKSKIKFVNGEFFSWYGSRMIKSFQYFHELHQIK